MGFSIGNIFKGVVNFGSKILGGAAGGFLGSGANPLGALFGGLSGLAGSFLGGAQKPKLPQSFETALPQASMDSMQSGGLLGIINRLVSVLSGVVNGLLSKLTGGDAGAPANPGLQIPPPQAYALAQDPTMNVA